MANEQTSAIVSKVWGLCLEMMESPTEIIWNN